jgi:Tfp pilus assembly protein PilF
MKTIAALIVAVFATTGAVYAQGTSGDEISRREALAHHRTGQELMLAEQFEQAAVEFTAAIELDPLLTLAHYGLGQAYMALKRYPSAIQAFIAGRGAYARIATLRQTNAIQMDRRRDDEIRELREYINAALRGQIKGANEGNIAQQQKRLEELEVMRKGKNRGVESAIPAELLLALGSAYYRNGQVGDAEREWLAAVAVNSKLGEAHNNLAVLYFTSGRNKEAQNALKSAEKARFPVHPQLKADIQTMK